MNNVKPEKLFDECKVPEQILALPIEHIIYRDFSDLLKTQPIDQETNTVPNTETRDSRQDFGSLLTALGLKLH